MLETMRNIVLFVGWPILVAGSVFIFIKGKRYKIIQPLNGNAWKTFYERISQSELFFPFDLKSKTSIPIRFRHRQYN